MFQCQGCFYVLIELDRHYFIFVVCHFSVVTSTLKLIFYCSLCTAGPGREYLYFTLGAKIIQC